MTPEVKKVKQTLTDSVCVCVSVRDFRVCVRRTEASDRCRLKGDAILRADVDALHLLEKTGDVVYTWPYRYLRRFGRDKVTHTHTHMHTHAHTHTHTHLVIVDVL